MALKRVLADKGTNTVYVWDTKTKFWLLTPDVTVPILESIPPPDGMAVTNIYVDRNTKKVVIDYNNE